MIELEDFSHLYASTVVFSYNLDVFIVMLSYFLKDRHPEVLIPMLRLSFKLDVQDTELSLDFAVNYDSPDYVPMLSRASIWTMLALKADLGCSSRGMREVSKYIDQYVPMVSTSHTDAHAHTIYTYIYIISLYYSYLYIYMYLHRP